MCVVKEVSLVGWVGIRGSVRDVCSKEEVLAGWVGIKGSVSDVCSKRKYHWWDGLG